MKPELFKAYPTYFTLIPLRRPGDVTHVPEKTKEVDGEKVTIPAHTRKEGKRPLHFNWTTRAYSNADVLKQCLNEGRNVGVRLKADQLVIDVDPRNGGDEGFADLCIELGLKPEHYHHVVTGSGGDHYYMSKPADVRVLDTIGGFKGVEFKSAGRQVVAAGSIHPETGKHYEFAFDSPGFDKPLLPVPPLLLKLITRPQRSALAEGGEASQEDIARALAGLDPLDFRDHDKWLRLMMACHHASGGDARHEFTEWSVTDPEFANDAEEIGRRWDSLHKEMTDGITVATLNHFLREAGKSNLTISDAANDFDSFDDAALFRGDDEESEADWLEGGKTDDDITRDGVKPEFAGNYDADSLHSLQELNREYIAVLEGSKFVIAKEEFDEVLKRKHWVRYKDKDFTTFYCNRFVEEAREDDDAKPKLKPLGTAWLKWPHRNQRKGVIFDPAGTHEEKLNLWTGFAYEPSKVGSWNYLQELIFEVLCDGKQDVNDYVLNWLRFMFQHPDERAQVALVFRGGQGTGKGTLGNTIAKVIGRHAMAISSPDLISGRFNSHLQDLIFLFADEAIRPEDRASESRIKHLITEPMVAFEGKGRDALLGKNHLHITMATNEQWAIRASADDRRHLVSDVNTKWQGKLDRFDKLWRELEAGGYKRLLFDMLKTPLPAGWLPIRNVPQTAALIDEKLRNLSPLAEWLFDACQQLRWPFETHDTKGQTRAFYEDFHIEFESWQRTKGIKPRSLRDATRDLTRLFPTADASLREVVGEREDLKTSPSDNRAPVIALPDWPEARAAFEKALRGDPGWQTPLPLKSDEEDWLG